MKKPLRHQKTGIVPKEKDSYATKKRSSGWKRARSLSQRRVPGKMNKTEAWYSEYLDHLLGNDQIVGWRYEGITLRIGDNCTYTPDFYVQLLNGEIEFHEIKGGYFRDDARVKFKTSQTIFPEFTFKWIEIKKVGKEYQVTKES